MGLMDANSGQSHSLDSAAYTKDILRTESLSTDISGRYESVALANADNVVRWQYRR